MRLGMVVLGMVALGMVVLGLVVLGLVQVPTLTLGSKLAAVEGGGVDGDEVADE